MALPLTADYRFSLANPVGEVLFGSGQPVKVAKFQPGDKNWRHQDIPGPKNDALLFGVDRKTPPVWVFELFTDCRSVTDALAALDPVAAVWNSPMVRGFPGQTMPLRYSIGGRTRLVNGRPRKFTPVMTAPTQGRIDVVAEFQLAEDIFYDDQVQSASVGVNPTIITGTGFTFPVSFPLYAATTPIARSITITVAGSESSWAQLAITGPVTDPWVSIGGITYALRGTVQASETITLSGRPWDGGVLSSTGVYKPQMLDPRSRLSRLQLAPGTYPVRYGGFDNTGTSHVEVTWRNAFSFL